MLKKLLSNWAKKPRLNLTYEKIKLVRGERGNEAQGDVLLQSAQKALKFQDACSANLDLENFLRIVRDLNAEHQAILEAESMQISPDRTIKLGPFIRDVLILTLEILLLLSTRHPLSCKLRINISDFIDDWNSSKSRCKSTIILSGMQLQRFVAFS